MIVPALALLAAGADAPVDDIEVIGSRLKLVSVSVTRDAQGRYQCALDRSTGLARLDAALCKATTACVRKGQATRDAVSACVEKSRPGLVARIRDYRDAARAQGAGA